MSKHGDLMVQRIVCLTDADLARLNILHSNTTIKEYLKDEGIEEFKVNQELVTFAIAYVAEMLLRGQGKTLREEEWSCL